MGKARGKRRVLNGFPEINADAAGIDVGNAQHWVAVPPGRDTESVRRFGCFTADLHGLANWLERCRIKTVAMESTALEVECLIQLRQDSLVIDDVSNNLNESLDLTVIVVAINESGKAFVLAYQHFSLAPRTFNLAIPFASSLPFGGYIVHADAIGEDANTNSIYCTLLDSSGGLTVSPP